MPTELLEALRKSYGTVSGRTDASGTVAVRNVTAHNALRALASRYEAVCTDVTHSGYPRLVRVTVQS